MCLTGLRMRESRRAGCMENRFEKGRGGCWGEGSRGGGPVCSRRGCCGDWRALAGAEKGRAMSVRMSERLLPSVVESWAREKVEDELALRAAKIAAR